MIFIFVYAIRENDIEMVSLILICSEKDVGKLERVQRREREVFEGLKLLPHHHHMRNSPCSLLSKRMTEILLG